MEDLQPGDIVQILPHLEGQCGSSHCYGWGQDMSEYVGHEVIVDRVASSYIYIMQDNHNHSWSECMFRKVTVTREFKLEESGKIKKIDFKGLVDKVGIEFEGYFKNTCPMFRRYEGKGLWSGHGDGSLSFGHISSSDYYEREYVTKPMEAEQLSVFLGVMDKHFRDGDYKINKSCGLHFHISLKNTVVYSSICNADFFYKVVEMFKRNHPTVYNERKEGNYSAASWETRYGDENAFLQRHFRKESGDRYHAVNFCYRKHGTVEVRFYGGSKANIVGLAESIQSVINIIAEKAHEKQSKKETIEAPQTSERYNQPLDLLIPNTNTYKRLRAIKIDKIIDRSNVLNLSIKLDKGGEMFIDTDNARYYKVKSRLAEAVLNKYGYLWDYIFKIYRNVPKSFFATELTRSGRTQEQLDDFILDSVIEQVRQIGHRYSRHDVEKHFIRNNGKIRLVNREGNSIDVGIIKS